MAGSTPGGTGRRRTSGNAPTPTRTSTRSAGRTAAPTGHPTRPAAAVPPKTPAKRRFWNYPRKEHRGLRRWLPSWRVVVGAMLAGGFLVLGLLVAAYQLTPIPEPDEFTTAQTTTVYYSDGTTPMGTFATQKRELVEYDTLPEYVGNAVVAAEDRTFYDNQGISVTGMGRAFINNIQGNRIQGGSTITQQYAERYYAGKTTTSYVGKFKETILAIKIGRSQDKPDVLGKYLNTIYWGRDSYGIQTASQAYFGVNAADLTISQAAMLAGIIPSPNNWDPRVSPEKAEQRWNYVLDGMVEGGFITAAERAEQVLPETIEFTKSDVYAGPQGYLLDMVRRELTSRTSTITDETLDTIGLKVVTTIEKPVQDQAVASVAALRDGTLAGEAPNPAMKVGMASIDPADGAIVALYGGPDFITQSRNAATQDAAQAGSTFKPFTLIAALEQGIGLDKRYNGRSPQTFDNWKVQNFGNDSEGTIDLVRATANSVNTVYAQLNLAVGPDKTADVAQRAGIRTTLDTIHAANVLGTDTVHPLDMASAYATIAAQGWYSTPFIVREATYLTDGAVAYQGAQDRVQVFQPDVTADATFAMTQVVERGSGQRWVKPLGRPIAGKTGTSTDNKSAWFVGFTPQIATAVAFYQPTADGKGQDPIATFGGVRQITGGTWPSALWASYMAQVFTLEKYAAVVPFPERANVGRQTPTSAPTVSAAPTTEAPPPPPTTATVPSGLEGKLRADAEAAVTNAGLVAQVSEEASDSVPAGRVISVSPGGGTTVDVGAAVSIVVSTGPAAPEPEVTPPPEDPGTEPEPGANPTP